MNKSVFLGISILELSKILMYEFLVGYAKPKYGEKAKLCYMDTDSFMVYIKTDGTYENIAEDVKTKLGEKIKTKFVGLRAKRYSYLIDGSTEDKKAKVTKSIP